MSFEPPQSGSCPLVLSYNASWDYVPKVVALKGGGAQNTPCLKSVVSLLSGGTSTVLAAGSGRSPCYAHTCPPPTTWAQVLFWTLIAFPFMGSSLFYPQQHSLTLNYRSKD